MSDRRGTLKLLEVGLMNPPETFLRLKLVGLARRGVSVTVSATPSSRDGPKRLEGVTVIPAPSWGETPLRAALSLIPAAVRVGIRRPQVLRKTVQAARRPLRPGGGLGDSIKRLRSYLSLALIEPDVVHAEWNTAAMHYLPMASVWRCPTVISCHAEMDIQPHDAYPMFEIYARSLRASFERASAVHCVSERVAEAAVEAGMDPRKAWLIRPGVDPEFFSPGPCRSSIRNGGEGNRPLRVIAVSDFRWVKAHEYAVRAIDQLSRAGVPVSLEIVGGDPADGIPEESDRLRVEHAIARSALTDRVVLAGRLSPLELRDRLRGADVIMHTSLAEGLPTAVLEGMACGLPAVVTDCGGVSEAVRHGVEGLVVPLRDVDGLAAALRSLYSDEALRLRMGLAARKRVEHEFTLERQLEGFLAMYHAVRSGAPSGLPPVIATKPRLHVLAVAPLSSSQGLDDAMEAVAMVRAAGVDCRLRIIGRGSYRPALLYTRGQLGLSRYVELEDPMDWFAPRCGQALAWGDVLLDASLRDPPLAAIAAARARGMPVISTAVASLAGADDAIAVPPGEPEAIAGALRAHAAGQAAQPSMTSAAASSIVHSRASPASVSSSSR